jgi:hypothetical protein
MKTEIKYFLEQYPEFNNDDYKIESIESHRYNGDYTINVFDYDYEDGEYVFLKSYWCKFWNNETETTYQFEEERFIRYKKISVNIDDSSLEYGVHYDYNENDYMYKNPEYRKMFGNVDYNKIENNVVEAWQKDNEQKVREEIARKILSGEIKLNFYCSDSDGWGAPYSQIQKIYKV